MRRKFRIFSTLTAMVLVLIVMCVGIWAATQASVTSTGGNLTFTAGSDVFATVDLDASGAGTSTTLDKTFTFSGSETNSDAAETVTLPDFTFSSENQTYTFTIAVTNTYSGSDETYNLNASLQLTEVDESNQFKVQVNSVDYSTLLNETIAKGANKTFTVTVTYMGDFATSATGSINFILQLTKGV